MVPGRVGQGGGRFDWGICSRHFFSDTIMAKSAPVASFILRRLSISF
jgi:hypothetical protein